MYNLHTTYNKYKNSKFKINITLKVFSRLSAQTCTSTLLSNGMFFIIIVYKIINVFYFYSLSNKNELIKYISQMATIQNNTYN